jgi:hypothetical protein
MRDGPRGVATRSARGETPVKPVAMIADAFRDPFGGSGTILIAAGEDQ